MSTLLKSVGFLSLFLLTGYPAEAGVEYTVEYLGDFAPVALNNNGDVAGNTGSTGLIWSKGNTKYLPTVNGATNYVTDMNDHGEVVGYYMPQNGETHAFLYSGGEISALKNLGDGNTSAEGINNSGQIAGDFWGADLSVQGFRYDDGSITGLSKSGSNQIVAHKINSAGEIVGSYITSDDRIAHAFVYRNGEVKELGTLEGNSYAVDINDAGKIVGSSYLQGGAIQHAFLYENSPMLDLGSSDYDSYATSINKQSEIVGAESSLAFIYSHGEMTDMNQLIDNTSKLRLYSAYGINDNGQILAGGYFDYEGGVSGAFLLTPVPEPSSIILLSIGITTLFIYTQYQYRKSQKIRNSAF